MGKVHWIANALPVAQVYTVAITGDDNTTTYKATINGKTVQVIGTGVSTAATATALQVALNGSTIPEFQEVLWTVNTSTVTGTAKIPGTPFIVAATVSGGAGTLTGTAVTAATGPNHFDNAANWDTGAVPIAADDVYYDLSLASCLYNIDQNAITLASLNIPASYSGNIGLPLQNAKQYFEYRNRQLKISATAVNIGYGTGGGSPLINLNTGTVATAIIARLGKAQQSNIPPFLWTGSNASNTLELVTGSMGAAFYAGDTCQATFKIGGTNASDCNIYVGVGATIVGWTQSGGTAETNTNVTTVNKYGGQLTVTAGAITNLNNFGGAVIYNSVGTLGTAVVGATGILDYSQDLRAKTTTNPIQAYAGAQIKDPNNVSAGTIPQAVTPVGCALANIVWITGPGHTYTPS